MDSHVGGRVGDGIVVPETASAPGVGVNFSVPRPSDEDVGMLLAAAAPVKAPDPGRRGLDRRVQQVSERNAPLSRRISLGEIQRVVGLVIVGCPRAPGNVFYRGQVFDECEAAAIYIVDGTASVCLRSHDEVVVGKHAAACETSQQEYNDRLEAFHSRISRGK